jgi:hypothetical protein
LLRALSFIIYRRTGSSILAKKKNGRTFLIACTCFGKNMHLWIMDWEDK